MGATSLFKACPRSLKAFFFQLNHGERQIDNPIEMKAINDPKTPNNVKYFSFK
jgi:hypothetical protein